MNNISRKFGTEKCIVICCDCGKVKTTDDRWIDAPIEVIEKTDGYKNRSHTYCTACSKKVRMAGKIGVVFAKRIGKNYGNWFANYNESYTRAKSSEEDLYKCIVGLVSGFYKLENSSNYDDDSIAEELAATIHLRGVYNIPQPSEYAKIVDYVTTNCA